MEMVSLLSSRGVLTDVLIRFVLLHKMAFVLSCGMAYIHYIYHAVRY